MIATHNLDHTGEGNTTEYAVYRYLCIKATEGVRRSVYLDSSPDKNPTIGIGFNLKVKVILASVLKTFGVEGDAAVTAFQKVIKDTAQGNLQTALNQKLAESAIPG
jgi:hypothetical protein